MTKFFADTDVFTYFKVEGVKNFMFELIKSEKKNIFFPNRLPFPLLRHNEIQIFNKTSPTQQRRRREGGHPRTIRKPANIYSKSSIHCGAKSCQHYNKL
jgi:hypothetical protein